MVSIRELKPTTVNSLKKIYVDYPQIENLVICIPAPGGTKEFSAIITDCIPDFHLIGDSQCYPLYFYEEIGDKNKR